MKYLLFIISLAVISGALFYYLMENDKDFKMKMIALKKAREEKNN